MKYSPIITYIGVGLILISLVASIVGAIMRPESVPEGTFPLWSFVTLGSIVAIICSVLGLMLYSVVLILTARNETNWKVIWILSVLVLGIFAALGFLIFIANKDPNIQTKNSASKGRLA